MEVIGFTVGLASLAGLYSCCLQAIEQINIAASLGKDFQKLSSMLQVELYLLEQWGTKAGMNVDGSVRDGRHGYPILRTDRGRVIIFGILANIERTLSDKDNLSKKYGLDSARVLPPTANSTLAGTIESIQQAGTKIREQKSFCKKFLWAIKDKGKFESLIADLGAFVEKLYSLVSPAEGIQGVIEALAELQNFLEAIAKETGEGFLAQDQFRDEAMQFIQRTNRETLLSWIGLISTEQDYDETKRERQPGTCAWIFRTAEFRAFHTGASTSNILWIHGGPGTGKTFLSASIVEFLEQRSSLPVAYFFCKNGDIEKRNPVSILRSWIYQLASHRMEALGVIESFNRGSGGATEGKLWDLFPKIVDRLRCSYLVVDGFDELADYQPDARHRRTGVIELFLKRLFNSVNGSTTKVIMVSRDEPIIRAGLTKYCRDFQEYAMSLDDTAEDIRVFARAIISPIGIQDSTIERQFINQLSEDCQGMFLWVRLEGERLEEGMDPREVRGILSSMPRGLGHSYERNLRRILGLDQEMRNQARSILRWILFATRPLSVVELLHLLAANERSTLITTEVPVPITDDYIRRKISKLCGSIVEVQGEVEPANRTIHFVHFSANEFLLSRQNQIDHPDLAEFFYLTPGLDHGILASSCLSLLLTDSETEPVSKALDYPRSQWMNHLQLSSESYTSSCLTLQKRLFHPGLPFDRWIQSQVKNHNPTPPGAACWFGLTNVFEVLSTKLGHPLSKPGQRGHSGARVKAAMRDLFSSLKRYILRLTVGGMPDRPISRSIVHGVCRGPISTIKIPDQYRQTPLDAAVSVGRALIVDIDVNAADNGGCSPLFAAASGGHAVVVEQLIALPHIDVSAGDGDECSPLHAAVREGHTAVLEQLLSRQDADINACRNGTPPVYTALDRERKAIATILLQSLQIIVHHMNSSRQSLLHIAASRGCEEAVSILIGRSDVDVKAMCSLEGIDVCKPGNRGITLLHIAAICGNRDLAEWLMCRYNADINTVDVDGWTPLYLAASQGHGDTVRMLLAAPNIRFDWPGADVTETGHVGWLTREDQHNAARFLAHLKG